MPIRTEYFFMFLIRNASLMVSASRTIGGEIAWWPSVYRMQRRVVHRRAALRRVVHRRAALRRAALRRVGLRRVGPLPAALQPPEQASER
jgi:hypothetical protein